MVLEDRSSLGVPPAEILRGGCAQDGFQDQIRALRVHRDALRFDVHTGGIRGFDEQRGTCGALTRCVGDLTQGTVVWGQEKTTGLETVRRRLCKEPVLSVDFTGGSREHGNIVVLRIAVQLESDAAWEENNVVGDAFWVVTWTGQFQSKTIDGQSERTIQTLKCMLRTCVWIFGGRWDTYLSLAEFLYNNSFHARIGMPPYELLCGRKCRTPIYWREAGQSELGSTEIIQKAAKSIQWNHDRLKTA
ncbi:hypothetical protein OSB04_un000664 [Centaurea solstitialis]|uniref:Uncharacterized protein n=1 Tax=Centaurea solstitialis TaxID=347529 RepID=A0AA38SC55_9ASTR|nr:hypothetical protein OSB04_un000664 [Centaurea solstitialis]